jgi:uncharacterized repeat protein (TIGR01451 family)
MKHTFFALLTLLLLLPAGRLAAQEPGEISVTPGGPISAGRPTELALTRVGSTTIDLRNLPKIPPKKRERPEREEPDVTPTALPGILPPPSAPNASTPPGPSAPAPSPAANFLGLDFNTWGAGHPPDPNGDVGPTYYLQTVNTAIGVYRKSDSTQVAAFTFDTLMSQGSFGNLCDTDNFGDPVVLYDTFEDRWIITDFAFQLDGSGNVINPPAVYQCFAVSKTGDPVSGGWNFYSLHTTDALCDYPKFGIWPDGLYMSSNLFGLAASGSFLNPRVWAFNKAQMYAGAPTVQVVTFNAPSAEFTVLPANARLQTGTPPAGSPNYYSVVWQFTNAVSIYKFHVDWNRISLSSFTGPFIAIAPASWASPPSTVPALGGNSNDTLALRLMMQNQYTNLGGVESLWDSHTVQGTTTTMAAPRWYQTVVTGGTVAAATTQAATFLPDTTVNRYMPSVAVDRAGDMAMGYSASSATLMPAIRYAGRLATDPVSTLPQTETSLVEGTGAQTGTGLTRWGDYSAMSLDPDGCTFWYTNEYYVATGGNWQTRIGSFVFPSCTPVASGTVSGTVTATAGGAPISGASVALGSRITTTDGSGVYTFTGIPSGTYPSITVTAPGFNPSTATNVVVTDSATTTQDFSLTAAPTSGCVTDTSQADLETGVPTNVDLTTSPGDGVLLNAPNVDQQNTAVTANGFGVTATSWAGQTFTAGVTGQLVQVDLDMFCSGCTGTTPNLTVSIRATTGATPLPTGADLASATIPGFNSGAGGFFSAVFATPPTLTAGVRYAIVFRATSNPSAGTYAYVCSCTTNSNPYTSGQRVTSANSGSTWTADVTAGGRDLGFKVYMKTGFAASGDLLSSLKDSNPPTGYSPTWTTLSWTATTPTNTAIAFQAAASNSVNGPFNFVGPDGTAATFYTTSGGSLSQFNGNRYLKYRAFLSTTDNTVTPTLSDVTICFTDVAPSPPDLSLTKSDGGATVAPGGTVAYTLTYANSGSIGATGVVITETVPANTTFNAGASTAGWSCTPSGNAGSTCTLAIGTLAAGGGSQTATFATTVVNPVPGGVTQISNTASIADDGTHGTDPTPANNVGSDTTPVSAAPDLSITKDDGGVTVVPGGSVTYTLTYSNSGSIGATGVVITETVPANTTFIPGSSTAGWSCTPDNTAGSTCTLLIGALAAGSGNQTATFAVTVANPLSASVTQISNTTTIADDGTNGTDPTPGNNTGSDTTPVLNGLFYAITPCRLLDTRNPNGPYGGPALSALSTRVFVAAGQCGIPADAKALSYNVAVTLGTAQGDLRFYPNGGTTPLVAVINYLANQTRTNNGIVVLGAAGDFVIKSDQPSGTVHVIIDLNGYFK